MIARGVRNTVGFDWNPESKQLYFTDNGRDWMSEDVPEDELNRITRVGEHFGAPYCLQGNIVDPEFGSGKSCAEQDGRSRLLYRPRALTGLSVAFSSESLPAFDAGCGRGSREENASNDMALQSVGRYKTGKKWSR